MAKFRPAGSKKKPVKSAWSVLPCAVTIVAAIALFALLFYAVLKSSL